MRSWVTYDLSKLQIFVKGLDDKHAVQVGIFGNKNQRNSGKSMTNAKLGAIHEYGSYSGGIPARSFLRMPLNLKSKEILKAALVGAKELLAKGQKVTLLKRLGIACEAAVDQAFGSRGFGRWPADSPETVRRKRNHGSDNSPLIDTSQLRRSIDSRVVKV